MTSTIHINESQSQYALRVCHHGLIQFIPAADDAAMREIAKAVFNEMKDIKDNLLFRLTILLFIATLRAFKLNPDIDPAHFCSECSAPGVLSPNVSKSNDLLSDTISALQNTLNAANDPKIRRAPREISQNAPTKEAENAGKEKKRIREEQEVFPTNKDILAKTFEAAFNGDKSLEVVTEDGDVKRMIEASSEQIAKECSF